MAKTILDIIKEVAPVIGIDVPTVVMTGVEREQVELKALANEMASRIAKAYDWQSLAVVATYPGDGVTEDFDLPADYDRMPVKAKVWSTSINRPLTPITDRDQWLGMEVQAFDMLFGAWIIYGDQIHIKTAVPSGVSAKHWYQSRLIVKPQTGDNKEAFDADSDTFRLNAQLLKLGMIWQWKANKGLAYGEDMASYEDLKDKLISGDKGSRILTIGRQRVPYDVDIAYPVSVVP